MRSFARIGRPRASAGNTPSQLKRMAHLAGENARLYISHKPSVAEDGERLTLIEWESPETLRAWATHPEHVLVKELGRQKFCEDYRLQVCEVVRVSTFMRRAEAGPRTGGAS